MAKERSGNPWIEYDWNASGLDFARVEPLDGALTGVAPDGFGAGEIGGVQCGGIIVILLHRRAAAGDRRHRDRMPRTDRGAMETVARHQHHAAYSGRRRRAAGFGNPCNLECGSFDASRVLL